MSSRAGARILGRVSKRRNKRAGKLALIEGNQVAALKAAPPDKPGTRDSRLRAGVVQPMPPVVGFLELDRVGDVRSVLRGFESGSFVNAARFADTMLRDDRISGTFATRVGALTASPIEVRPASSKRKHRKMAEMIGGSDEMPGLWWKMFPRHVQCELLAWGRYLGLGLAEIIWDTRDPNYWGFTTRIWHPQFVRWDESRSVYQVQTGDGYVDLPNIEENPNGDGKWILYMPYGYRAPWRRALFRPLCMLYLARQWAYRDWSRYSEKHGMPVDVVDLPETAPEDEKLKVMNDVANRGSEGSLFFPRGEDGAPQYGFKIVEPTSTSHQSFDRFISKLEADIAICIKGNNLTTEVQEGSRAAAKEHSGVDARVLAEDAGMADVLRDQGLVHWARANFNEEDHPPRPSYIVSPPEDDLKEAQTLETLGRAIMAHDLAGMRLDKDAVAEQWGLPIEQPEDVEVGEDGAAPPGGEGGDVQLTPSAIAAIVTVNEARAATGYGPLVTEGGKPDPDGNLTVAEFQAKNAATIAAAANAESGDAGAEEQADEPAPALDDDDDEPLTEDEDIIQRGLLRLIDHADDRLLARMSARPSAGVAGHARTARYADALKKAARLRAAQALAVDLRGIMQEIHKASSFDDLERRLLKRYRGKMSAEALRKVVERGNVMAQMAGRFGAHEEV